MSVKDAIEREKLYFATHPVYSTLPQNMLGTDILTTKLTKVMFTHIKHNLPEITKEIREKSKEVEERLSSTYLSMGWKIKGQKEENNDNFYSQPKKNR